MFGVTKNKLSGKLVQLQLHVVFIVVFIFCQNGVYSQTKTMADLIFWLEQANDKTFDDSAIIITRNYINYSNKSLSDNFKAHSLLNELLVSRGMLSEGIDVLRQAKKLLNKNVPTEDSLSALANQLIAADYFTLQNFDSACYYSSIAMNKIPEAHNFIRGDCFQILGYCAFKNGNLSNAHNFYKKAEEIFALNTSYSIRLLNLNFNQLELYAYQKLDNQFDRLYNSTIPLLKKIDDLNSYKLFYETLTKIYKKNNKPSNAISCLEKRDSIANLIGAEASKSEALKLEAKYENTIKRKEIENLKLLTNEQNNVLQKQKLVIWISIIASVIFLILLAIIAFFYKKQKSLSVQLNLQKLQIQSNLHELERLDLLNKKIFSVISQDFKKPL